MNSIEYIKKAKEDVAIAEKAEKRGDTQEAIEHWARSLRNYNLAIKREQSTKVKYKLGRQTNTILERISELQKSSSHSARNQDLEGKKPILAECEDGGGGGGIGGGGGGEEIEKRNNLELSVNVLGEDELPNITWEDIIGLESVKEIFRQNVQHPLEIPQVFTGNRQPSRSILLYGPPGVGKTMIVKALARECGIAFITVTSADIINKYVGESAKNMRSLFDLIKSKKPCIVFIDEIESLCGDRDGSNGNQHSGESSRVVDEFLIQFDGITGDLSNVLLIGATNYPWKLDGAIVRRLELRIMIPLPGENDRLALLKHLISLNRDDIGDQIPVESLSQIAQRTEFFSSSDLTNLVKEAYRQNANEIIKAHYFRRLLTNPKDSQSFIFIPVSEAEARLDPGETTRKIRYEEINQKSRIRARALRLDHLYYALERIKPVTGHEKLQQLEEWTLEHGAISQSS